MILHDFCSDCGKKYKIIIKEDFMHYICECSEELFPFKLNSGNLKYYKNVFEPPLCPKCNIQPIIDREDIKFESFYCCGKCGLSTAKNIKKRYRDEDTTEKVNDWKDLVKKTICDIRISQESLKHIESIKEYLNIKE